MKTFPAVRFAVALLALPLASLPAQDAKAPSPSQDPSTPRDTMKNGRAYSGMYSFVEDGEFVQITVEDDGKVTGYVSRYRKDQNDKDTFVDQFFRNGKLDGAKLSFTTEAVQGIWFVFVGTVERGEGKNPADEGYFVLKGTLDENIGDAAKKGTTNSRSVTFRRFPETAGISSTLESIPPVM